MCEQAERRRGRVEEERGGVGKRGEGKRFMRGGLRVSYHFLCLFQHSKKPYFGTPKNPKHFFSRFEFFSDL
jgi:hypothetical protein